MSDPRADALAELYAGLPSMECKGLCASTCRDPIPVSDVEFDLIATLCGGKIPDGPRFCCPLLDGERCTIYDRRPLICRMHGMIDPEQADEHGMPHWECPHGCRPSRWIGVFEALGLVDAAGNGPLSVRSLDQWVDGMLQKARADGHRVFGFHPCPDGSLALGVVDDEAR